MAQAQEHTSLAGSFKGVLEGELDRASPDEKANTVKQLIRRASSHSAMLVLEPIPLFDTAILTRAQHRLVRSIARLRGHSLDAQQVRDAFGIIRGRLVKPNLIITAVKLITFVPVVPEFWSGSVAYALTNTLGELSDRYFREGRTMSRAAVRSNFDQIFTEAWRDARQAKRNELKTMFRNREIRQRIREVKRAYRAGSIDAEEALRRSDAILDL
jgi:uncharacterized protein (DUF697 family)